MKQIVIPVTKGGNSQLAAELAPAYAEWFEVTARAMTVIPTDVTDAQAERTATATRQTLTDAEYSGDLAVLRRQNISRGLTRAIRRGELVLIGAPSVGPVVPLWGDTVPALIARRGRNPVIVVRDIEEQRSRRFERGFFARK